jgi:50S ribosomal protein L16 3-hydroxylase
LRTLPPLSRPHWTLLVQGLDLHVDAARDLLSMFRFIPEARLDDLMLSYASDGGGVGPHFDSYDVFLVQVQGRRRWRIGRQRDLTLREGMALKILERFEPENEWLLEPGDMLYLPPLWAHDGVAEGSECMTCSVGFRAPMASGLARDVLTRALDAHHEPPRDKRYRDPAQAATVAPGAVPQSLQDFARDAVATLLHDTQALDTALGEVLSEPKPSVWFEGGQRLRKGWGVSLDRRTRMLYDVRRVYINGEAFRASGRDARLVRRLADARALTPAEVGSLSAPARALLDDWALSGWLHGLPPDKFGLGGAP